MIVDNGDIERVTVAPPEADSPRVVDANTVLTDPIAAQLLQPIPRRDAQVIQRDRGVDLSQFAQHDAVQRARQAPHGLTVEQALGIAVGEALDHPGS